MKKLIASATIVTAGLFATSAVQAQPYNPADYPQPTEDGCTLYWYQGAPIKSCPPQEPDPTNCYTGDYQGAPIEICKPTGWTPPSDWTFNGEPIVMHVSKDYVAPVEAPAATTPEPETVPVTAPEPEPQVWQPPQWLVEFTTFLVAHGGW